jgi:DNA-binding transcriptional ArsR family regulator
MSKVSEVCEVLCLHQGAVNQARQDMISDKTAFRLAETFKAMGDVTRLKIINVLSAHELCVCDIAHLLGMTHSAVSHQLRILRVLKLVCSRKEGKVVFYTLDDYHIVNLFKQGLEHISEGR